MYLLINSCHELRGIISTSPNAHPRRASSPRSRSLLRRRHRRRGRVVLAPRATSHYDVGIYAELPAEGSLSKSDSRRKSGNIEHLE